ncbi:MAG: Reverse gyrase [Parcubacteria group bacterium GW2011_GWC1_41_7]|nr:MAG: Reverse gyrase [Parcubacteria group bacterium GW2011_GWC1_41_7]
MGYRLDLQNSADMDIPDLFSRIDRDRSIVKDMMEGRAREFLDPVKTALVIVESPTKAKTIANFFGRPARRIYGNYWVYEVSIGKVMINIIATINPNIFISRSLRE